MMMIEMMITTTMTQTTTPATGGSTSVRAIGSNIVYNNVCINMTYTLYFHKYKPCFLKVFLVTI